ncbi:MAG: hypothetical protein IJA10_11400 [Lachnospiraceae bacterium]|nr:hypothetical protein [Lachnospiraceae bacterium]
MSRYSYRRKGFDFGDFEITPREIIASISIIAVMILIGVLISGKISEHQMDRNEIYNKAVKIESTDLFQYGMDTNVGNAFVYGDLKAVDTVTYPEIEGEYMYVKKIKEKYTMHTRTVTKYRTVNGKRQSYTTTETYWTWDRVGSEDKKCNEVTFCGITFNVSKFDIPSSHHIDTIKESSHIRYKYYGVGAEFTGTIFTDLRDKTISDNTNFYNGMNIEETVEYLESGGGEIIFWIFWILLTGGCVFGFFYIDNKWLE